MKIRALTIIGAILMIAAIMPSLAFGQAPAGPITRYQSMFQIVNAPAQFDELLVYAEVKPGSATPPHIHGGNQYVTVLEGELTRQVYSPAPSVKQHPWHFSVAQRGTPNHRPADRRDLSATSGPQDSRSS